MIKDKEKMSSSLVTPDLPRVPLMTGDQHSQIMYMLERDSSSSNYMASMAGITKIPVARLEDMKWIIDSGVTNHMASYLDVLHDVQNVNSDLNRKVHFSNRGVTFVTHTGCYKFTDSEDLHDVLFVPEFQYNLLYYFILFYPGFCLFQDLSSEKLKEIGKESNGLYILVIKDRLNMDVRKVIK